MRLHSRNSEFQDILNELLQGNETQLTWLYQSIDLLSPEEKNSIKNAVENKLSEDPKNPLYLLLKGDLFRLGIGIPVDYEQAAAFYRPAMTLKISFAFRNMAVMIDNTFFITKNGTTDQMSFSGVQTNV